MNLRPMSKKGTGTSAAVLALKPVSRAPGGHKRKSVANEDSSPSPGPSLPSKKKKTGKDQVIELTEEERAKFAAWEKQKGRG